jgi:uncharacterized protein
MAVRHAAMGNRDTRVVKENSGDRVLPDPPYAEGVSLDWKSGALAEGVRCYRNREFWLAHEHWESVWLRLNEPEKNFLQALIQTTAAFHHLQKGNTRGTVSLLRRALQRLEPYPASFGGVDLVQLRREAGAWLRVLEDGTGARPEKFPRIWPD